SRTVRDVPDEARRCARQLEDATDHLEVLTLLAADVVDLAGGCLAQDELDRGAVVVGVQPFASLPAVSVYRERVACERIRDEQREELLGVLTGAVVVRAARDARVDPVRTDV